MSMDGYLPDGIEQADIDRAYGYDRSDPEDDYCPYCWCLQCQCDRLYDEWVDRQMEAK